MSGTATLADLDRQMLAYRLEELSRDATRVAVALHDDRPHGHVTPCLDRLSALLTLVQTDRERWEAALRGAANARRLA